MPDPIAVSARTRIQLCGRLSVEIDGVQVVGRLRGKQVPLLLAYLVLNRERAVARDELIGTLWPDRAPQSQDAALRTLLSRLRSALGASVLVGRDELSLSLPEPAWIDVEAAAEELEQARQALARGDPRAAWAEAQVPLNIASRGLLPGSQADWLESWRREVEEVRLQALEVVGRAGLGLGGSQLSSAERAARTLIETEPYRESGYVMLMEALAAQGNVAQALTVFDRVRRLLRDELGTAPSAETMAAHERLLHAPGATEVEDSPPEQPSRIELPATIAARTREDLVGREAELARLRSAWADVHARAPASGERTGAVVLLAGDAGIGKTRLTAELAVRVHEDGGLVLAGHSPEETLAPYQPFLEALRHYVLKAPVDELWARAQEHGSELSRLVPELRRRLPRLPPLIEGEPETERYRLFEAVAGLLASLTAAAPTLLVLDDLHWADRPSLLLLRHLARAPELSRLLIVGAYRSSEPALGPLGDTLAELRRDRLLTPVSVGGLEERETAQLVQARIGEEPSSAFTRALHEETEGNPFFVEEMVRHLRDVAALDPESSDAYNLQRFGLPEGVKDVIARRLSRLDQSALSWLRAAAVIGRDFDLSLLERVAGLDEPEFLNALDAAIATGVVAESPEGAGRYGFSHALIRETLYDGMTARRRARSHRIVGEAIEASGADRNLAALALHFTRAADQKEADRAIRYAQRAGEEATSMLAHEDAAEHYVRALEVLDRFQPSALARRCELLLALGEAHVRSGERAKAWDTLLEAAKLARELHDSESLAHAAIGASSRYVQQPGVVDEELIALLDDALEATASEHTLTRVRLLGRLCGALYYAPQRDRMRALSAEATQLARELDDPEALALAAAARRRASWEPAYLEERLTDSTELLTMARKAQDLELTLQGHAWLVVDLLERGERDAVEAQIESFVAGAERLRQPFYNWQASVWRAMLALLDGRLADTEECAERALSLGARTETGTATQYYAIQLHILRHEQGRLAELEVPARQLVGASPAIHAWRAGFGRVLFEIGEVEEAQRELDALAQHDFTDIPRDANWLIAITLMAELAAGLGDAERAALLYELLLPHRDFNIVVALAALCLGSAARYLGQLALTIGRRAEAIEHFEQALVGNAAVRSPLWLAHTQLDYAKAVARSRSAEMLIDTAAETARELQLPQLARRARELRGS